MKKYLLFYMDGAGRPEKFNGYFSSFSYCKKFLNKEGYKEGLYEAYGLWLVKSMTTGKWCEIRFKEGGERVRVGKWFVNRSFDGDIPVLNAITGIY